jgi:hypothetical protein
MTAGANLRDGSGESPFAEEMSANINRMVVLVERE